MYIMDWEMLPMLGSGTKRKAAHLTAYFGTDELNLIQVHKNLDRLLLGLRSELSIIEMNGRIFRSAPLQSGCLAAYN